MSTIHVKLANGHEYDINDPNDSISDADAYKFAASQDSQSANTAASTAEPAQPASAGPFDTSKMSGDFLPGPTEFAKRAVNAAVDVPVGMAKGAAQAVYAIPGVESAVEKLWKLPEGSLANAVDSTNATQTAGKAIDAALATKGVLNVPAGTTFAADQSTALPQAATIGSRIADAGYGVLDTGNAMLEGAKRYFASGGPVTADKIGYGVAKYGTSMVKKVLGGMGLGAGYDAWKTMTGK